MQDKINSAPTLHKLLTPCYCNFTGRWCAFSAGQRASIYDCSDATCSSWCTTALSSKIPRYLASWTRMGHAEEGTYAFSRACHNHCRIATTGARCMEQSIVGWHSAPLWPFDARINDWVVARGTVHCVLMWLWAPLTVTCVFHLVWIYHIFLQWESTCHINFHYMNLSLKVLHFFQSVYVDRNLFFFTYTKWGTDS